MPRYKKLQTRVVQSPKQRKWGSQRKKGSRAKTNGARPNKEFKPPYQRPKLLAQAVDAQERKCIGHRFRWRGKKKDLEALAREEEDSEPKEGETDKEEGEKEGRIDEGERNLAFRCVSKNGY